MQEISPLYQSYDGYGYLRQERINQRVEEPSDVERPRRREPAQNGDAGDERISRRHRPYDVDKTHYPTFHAFQHVVGPIVALFSQLVFLCRFQFFLLRRRGIASNLLQRGDVHLVTLLEF